VPLIKQIKGWPAVLALAALGQLFLAQSESAWTLWPGLAFFLAALWALRQRPFRVPDLSVPKGELVLFSLICLLGFFFQLYRIDLVPAGMHTDQGLIGMSALRILNEGWSPFYEAYDFQFPTPLLFYQLAGWFGLVGSSFFNFHLFFALVSLASFPFIYWTFRQLSGPRVALMSLALLAVMRWNWIETRNGYPSIQMGLYLFAALAFLLYGLRKNKPWALFISAVSCGLGLYTYQAFKFVPFLMAMLLVFEYFRKKRETKIRPKTIWTAVLLFFLIAAPHINYYVQHKTFGSREMDVFLFKQVAEQKNLQPLWDVWTGTALMLNRSGDENARHNIPGHRMLDDVSAPLFILGLGLAWRMRKQRQGFYPTAGFFIMLLPGLLSTDIAHANRLVAAAPFAAYFAALTGEGLLSMSLDRFPKSRTRVWVVCGLVLAFLATQNVYTYFVKQANDERCQQAFGLEQTHIGRSIEAAEKAAPGRHHFFIGSFYFRYNTVDFLSYPARRDVFAFNLQDWAAGRIPRDKDSMVFLESSKKGVADFLKRIIPSMDLAPYKNPQGRTLYYLGEIHSDLLGKIEPWERGLKGVYINSADWRAKPVKVQWDPVLNFGSKKDFPFNDFPPFRIRWTGSLAVPAGGVYEFQVLVLDKDRARLWLDGRTVELEKPFSLKAGVHDLRLDFEKDSGDQLTLHLIWKKPGEEKWNVVPAEAFGLIR
jgi:4-amino-4-deoxy-L-arabinose transferase-like glycosyltransferase